MTGFLCHILHLSRLKLCLVLDKKQKGGVGIAKHARRLRKRGRNTLWDVGLPAAGDTLRRAVQHVLNAAALAAASQSLDDFTVLRAR